MHLLDLPDALLHCIFEHLDRRSRQECSRVPCPPTSPCRKLRAHPGINCGYKCQVVDWDKSKKVVSRQPDLVWPKHAPAPKRLSLYARKVSNGQHLKQACTFLSKHVRHVQHVNSLHLKGWELLGLNDRHGDDFYLLTDTINHLPSLTSLHLERCSDIRVLTHACQHAEGGVLAGLHSLTLQNAVIDDDDGAWWMGNDADEDTSCLTSTMRNIGDGLKMLHLTHLSITCPNTWRMDADVSALGQLAQLQSLELALPALRLRGLRNVARGCIHLRHLHLVHTGGIISGRSTGRSGTGQEGVGLATASTANTAAAAAAGGPSSMFEDDEEGRCIWPALVEACLLLDCRALAQAELALYSTDTAPAMQRLYLQLLAYEAIPDSVVASLVGCHALQQPLVLYDPCQHAIRSLAPLASRLQQLVLVQPTSADLATAAAELSVLPQLHSLAMYSPHATAEQYERLLMSNLGSVQRLILGVSTVHTGYGRFAPVNKHASHLEKALRRVSSPSPSTQAGGSRQRKGGAGAQGSSALMTAAVAEPVDVAALHVYVGCWCPAANIDHDRTDRTAAYSNLQKLSCSSETLWWQHVHQQHGADYALNNRGPGSLADSCTQSGLAGQIAENSRGDSNRVAAPAPAPLEAKARTAPSAACRIVVHEASGNSAADMALQGSSYFAGLQTHLEQLQELEKVHRPRYAAAYGLEGSEDDTGSEFEDSLQLYQQEYPDVYVDAEYDTDDDDGYFITPDGQVIRIL